MATRAKAVVKANPLPDINALPPSVFDHPMLHAIINAYASGTSKKAVVAKFKLPLAYINAVIYEYLGKYDN